MEYRVTALKDVTIRAYVRLKPHGEREEWISMRAGEVREGLGMLLGVHPSSAPGQPVVHVRGIAMIMGDGWSPDQLPMDFLGLFRLEVQGSAHSDGSAH